MQMRSAKVLLRTLSACALVGCTTTTAEPAATPSPGDAEGEPQVAHEQQALEKRLQLLENQALSELRKLRESRQASTGAAEPARDDEASDADDELMILGGARHEVFLGCLCGEHRPDSVFNMLGEHGSHASPASIRNKFAPYGSNYDDTSACNVAATHPPVVMAPDGKSLGLLTLNASLERRITAPSVFNWLTRMCGE
jgi:hypothetical protein